MPSSSLSSSSSSDITPDPSNPLLSSLSSHKWSNCECYPSSKHGHSYDHFTAEVFGQCLYSNQELASFYVGMSSLGFWVMCQLPQFIKNCKRGSASGLSKWFLLEWFLGDLLNLIGCILAHQLITQKATGILFMVVDIAIISQKLFYGIRKRNRAKAKRALYGREYGSSMTNEPTASSALLGDRTMHTNVNPNSHCHRMNGGSALNGSASQPPRPSSSNSASNTSPRGRRLQSVAEGEEYEQDLGAGADVNADADANAEVNATGEVLSLTNNQTQSSSSSSSRNGRTRSKPTQKSVSSVLNLTIAIAVLSMVLGGAHFSHVQSVFSSDSNLESNGDTEFGLGRRRMDQGKPDHPLPPCEVAQKPTKAEQATGYTFGWISAIVYLNSRLPQLWKNYKRKSVEGLSWIMFLNAVLGNTTYGLGIVLRDSSPKALQSAMPWLIGSLGTLFLDFFIIVQFSLYPDTVSQKGHRLSVASARHRRMLSDRSSYRSITTDSIDEHLPIDTANAANAVVGAETVTPPSGHLEEGGGISADFGALEEIEEDPEEAPDTQGLFGIVAWTTSPLFGPTRINWREANPLRDHASMSVIPAQSSNLHHSPENRTRRSSTTQARADSF